MTGPYDLIGWGYYYVFFFLPCVFELVGCFLQVVFEMTTFQAFGGCAGRKSWKHRHGILTSYCLCVCLSCVVFFLHGRVCLGFPGLFNMFS